MMHAGTPLPLPLGEVSERSEDGEGQRCADRTCQALSVSFADSSPKGRAKAGAAVNTDAARILTSPGAGTMMAVLKYGKEQLFP